MRHPSERYSRGKLLIPVCIYSRDKLPLTIVRLTAETLDRIAAHGFTEIRVNGCIFRIIADVMMIVDGEHGATMQLFIPIDEHECVLDEVNPIDLARVIEASVHDRYPHEIRTTRYAYVRQPIEW